jgi:glyceraldehyde 3-phosphate dehydrogenase (phosphorylating)
MGYHRTKLIEEAIMTKVAINGLGRIGRAIFKIVLETPELELVAVNDLIQAENLAYLLSYDSANGRYRRRVRVEGDWLVAGDDRCRLLHEKDPAALPWKELGVGLVFECTGVFRKAPELRKHLEAGAKRVLLSAPDKSGELPTVVHGVNRADQDAMISLASCTTNCITPVVEIVDRHWGIRKAMMTTIHAYTASQSLVDGPKSKWRRGRAAAVNFVPTSTGAAKATTRVLPAMQGIFDGVAVRGPVPVGSLADIVMLTKQPTDVAQVNRIFRQEAQGTRYHDILGVTDIPLVSSDIVQDPRASVVDLTMTQVVDGDLLKIMSWYDNEWGYSSQMVREAVRLAG